MESLSVWYLRTYQFVSEISLVSCTHSFNFQYNQLVCKYHIDRVSMKHSIHDFLSFKSLRHYFLVPMGTVKRFR